MSYTGNPSRSKRGTTSGFNMDIQSAFKYTYLLSFLITVLRAQRTRLGLTIVVPGGDKSADLIGPGINDCRRATFSVRVLRSLGIIPSVSNISLDQRRNGAIEILDVFCSEIFRDTNTLMTLRINDRDKQELWKMEYTESVAEEFGYPVISYNPSYTGAMEYEKEKLVLQMAPTVYHQAQAILELLKNFNWTHFSIVSTTDDSYFEFNAAIDSLMKEHEARRKITDKFSYTKLKTMIFPVSSNGDVVKSMVKFLRNTNLDENRIYLLHSIGYAKDFIEAAQKCGLASSEHVWILTSDSVGVISRWTVFPVGTLGVTHQFTGELSKSIQTALVNAGVVWATALGNFATDIDKSNALPQYSCDNTSASSPWPYGKELFKYMKRVSIVDSQRTIGFHDNGLSKFVELQIVNTQLDRQTGRVVFRQIGKWLPVRNAGSVELKLFLDGIMWPGMQSFPPKGRPNKRFFRISTLQEEPYVMYRSPENKTGKCVSPAVKCRITYNSTLHENNSTVENGTIQWCCAGLSIDLLKIMSEKMEFDFTLREVPDRVCGIQNQQSLEWNGLIRQLQTRETDMVMTSLQITPDRASAVDFTMPYLETGTAIIVKLRKDSVSPTAVLEPYNLPAWCLILAFSVHSVGASIFIFEWLSPRGLDQGRTPMREHTFSLFRSFWLVWAMLFQSSVSADNPRGISSRFLGNVWALFALVFLASYTANLAAFMITKDTYYNLTGLEDWRLVNPWQHKPQPFTFGTIPNGSTEETLRQYHPRMFKYMTRYNQHNVSNAIRALKNGDIDAFIYDSSPLRYQVGIDDGCTLMEVGKPAAMSGYGVAFPKGSEKLVEEVNRIILELEEDGELGRLRNFWLSGPCHKKNRIGQSSDKLDILNFTSAFILLAVGIAVGGVLLILEHVYFRFGRRCLKKYDKWGCCALVSLSMGKSLTFEQSVMDAVDFCKKHKCKDPLCETQMWKVRHELDLALLKIEKLNSELRRSKVKGIKSAPEKTRSTPDKDSGTYSSLKKEEAESEKPIKESGDEDEGHYASMATPEAETMQPNRQEVVADVNHDNHSVPNRERNGMRRSPSYNQAVEADSGGIEPIDNTAKSKTRYNDGKYYANVNTEEDDGQV